MFLFGDGDCGQLGMGEDVTERLRPFPLSIDGKKVLQVACGGMHTVVLTEDRCVYSWGVNDEGALGRKTAGELWEKYGVNGFSDVPAGDSYTPGRVLFTEAEQMDNRNLEFPNEVVQISAGDSHTCVLMRCGSVWAWGTFRDSSGVMGFSPSQRIQLVPCCIYRPEKPAEQIVRISSGADHVAAITAAGELLTWGTGQQGQLGRVGGRLSGRIKMETLTQPHPVPLKAAAGRQGAAARKIVDVDCGTYTTFALAENGNVYACGLNNYGQLALSNLEPVFVPTKIKSLEGKDVKKLCSGQHHTLAITEGGQILSFGRPTYGRLGQLQADSNSDSACPTPSYVDCLDGIRVTGAAAGLAVSGCFDDKGDAFLWGFGTSNQLGKGDDDEDEKTPRKLAETKRFTGVKVVQLEFGGQHVALLCVSKN